MTAYMIVDLDIHDAKGFEAYRDAVPPFIAKYGGTYLVRGGAHEVIEGDWQPHRMIVFRFPDRQSIRNMFADEDYEKIAEIRFRSAKSSIVAVDGID